MCQNMQSWKFIGWPQSAGIAVSIVQIFFLFTNVASLCFSLITSSYAWYILNKDSYAWFEEKYINVDDFFKMGE
jgi:hypothetical protein